MIDLNNKQWVFDTAAKGMLEQGKRSLLLENNPGSVSDTCCYQNEYGHHCAVGFCLKAAGAGPKLMASSMPIDYLIDWGDVRGDRGFLTQLQSVHDDHAPEDWPLLLIHLASRFWLSPNVVREWEKNNA